MDTRRNLLRKIGLGAASSLFAGMGIQLTKQTKPNQPYDATWWVLGDLQQGAYLGEGWFLSDLSPIERGASVISFQKKNGEIARVHLCAHFGTPKGIASTRYLDFLLMDGGTGNTPSNEGLGRVILSLAARVQDSENLLVEELQEKLQTHEERLFRYKEEGLT